MARPTEQQLQVIEHESGRAVVFAVAGSGKTTTMAWRVQRLVNKRGVSAKRIVTTTFSKFARDQMRVKFDELGISSEVLTMTLHQFASRVIKLAEKKINFMPRVQVADDGRQRKALKQAKDNLIGSGNIQDEAICLLVKEISDDDFFSILGKMKGGLVFTEAGFNRIPEQLKEISAIKCFEPPSRWLELLIDSYEEVRVDQRFRGFDDMLVDALDAVYSNQIMRAEMSARFDYIIVDEYQDINKAQDALVRICDEKRGNLMVIGDDDQTIYEWRGATPAFIREKIISPEWIHYFLDLNFRSCAPQVILAAQCISKNKMRAEKKMQPTGDFSGELAVIKCTGNETQAKKIISLIQQKVNEGVPLGDQVILIRRYDQSLPIEKELIQNKIKYKIPGASFFFDRKEVQFVMSFLLLFKLEQRINLEERTPTQAERVEYKTLLNQVAYRAKTYLKTKTEVATICEEALNASNNLANSIREYASEREDQNFSNAIALAKFYESALSPINLTVKDLIQKLETTINIREKIISAAPDNSIGLQRVGVLDGIKSFAGSRSLDEFLAEADELREYWHNGLKDEQESSILRIYTVFKAKGLEFPVVYLPDTHKQADGIKVDAWGMSPSFDMEISAGPEEERRIFYVAITRAIRDLYILYWQEPSQYLAEANLDQILEYSEMARSVLASTEELNEIDARQLGRWFSALSLRYETKHTFSNAFARLNGEQVDHIENRINNAIVYLKNDPKTSIRDKLNYETLQSMWAESRTMSDRIRQIIDTSEDEGEGAVTPHPSPQAPGKDPFDELFGDN